MRREVTVCDSCQQVIQRGYRPYPIPVRRMLAEAGKVRFLRVALSSQPYTNGAGETEQDHIVLDLCPSCARRLVRALETIASRLQSQGQPSPNGKEGRFGHAALV